MAGCDSSGEIRMLQSGSFFCCHKCSLCERAAIQEMDDQKGLGAPPNKRKALCTAKCTACQTYTE